MAEQRISRKSAREKGKKFERDLANSLKKIGIDAHRVPMSGALAWMKGDVVEFDTTPHHVHECKNQETLCIPEWWRQAIAQVKDDELPVLHFTSVRKPAYTVVQSALFDEMLSQYENRRPELPLTVIDFPRRKNFWKYATGNSAKLTVYLYPVDDDNELVIMLQEIYLLLRKFSSSIPAVSGVATDDMSVAPHSTS